MDVIVDNLPAYVTYFGVTLRLTVYAGVLSLALGLLLAAMRVSPLRPLRWFAAAYVELLRNTPLTLVFFFLILVAPQFGIRLPFGFPGFAVVALTTYTAAFVCEAIRSGINSVGIGQAEAARAVGLTFGQTLTQVVLPQAFRTVIPPLINVFIALAKNTSVAAGFGVVELMGGGRRLTTANPGDVIWILIGIALGYLVITITLGAIAARVERKVAFTR